MIIAISGLSGCGNSSTSKILASHLGLELINWTFRDLSKEKNLDFNTMHELAKKDDSYDIELDNRQKEMAIKSANCVLSSRLAVYLLKDIADFKVYLDYPLEVRAQRIYKREKGSFEEKFQETKKRDMDNSIRYKRIYNLDMSSFSSFCDLVLKDEKLSAEENAQLIISSMKNKNLI